MVIDVNRRKKKIKSSFIVVIGVIVVIALMIGGYLVSSYNNIVVKEEAVSSSLANVDAQLKRRTDLIPNLVNTVKGYMEHEENIINSITGARESLVSASTLEEKSKANKELNEAINNLYVIVENYPDLKASENFIALQDEIAGSENRISTSRIDYNKAVKEYNLLIKRFPLNLIAANFGFEKADYFSVDEEDKNVPVVDFK